MARIKHIAISTQDPEASAKFYIEAMGLHEVGKIDSPSVSGFFLSDGYVNLALLNFKNDDVAGKEKGAGYSGLHHIGFVVEDTETASAQIRAANVMPRDDINAALAMGTGGARGGSHEFKFAAPDGVTIDISQVGWATEPRKEEVPSSSASR